MLEPALMSYIAIMSITPGPNNLMLAASGVRFGMRRTMPHILGISIGAGVQAGLTAVLLAALLEKLTRFRLALAVAGCVYLLWFSWKMARSAGPGEAKENRPMGFLGAALFQWINPKAWMMAINAAILFLPASGIGRERYAGLMTLTFVLINLPCVSLWALTGDRLRRTLSSPRALMAFNLVMAGLMAGTALYLLVDEMRGLALFS
ncbi:LysE family translocator [Paludibacterium paludis]|uniref:Membrane protein n=1 Tax=Paludibacterium paludis TaxID=1225769 RepID=A0A918UBN6_9NEIS|nr:LysE family translocator [Paludibacterium paludis]GGY26711.1 membrane protein [Paludibacterium paludis]